MTREEKALIIDELKEKFNANMFFYITDASGMSVANVNKFRRLCFEKGVEYKVLKNTLIRKALEDVDGDYSPLNNTALKGFSGVMFTNEAGKVPAMLLKEFHKATKGAKPTLKGASIDKSLFIGIENLDMLSSIKSKDELVGEIIGLLQSPAKNVISALKSSGNKVAGILKTLSEREG